MNFRRSCGRAWVCVALLILHAGVASATTLRKVNIVHLIDQSPIILAGRVASVTDGIAENGMPYTEVTISVSDTVKGTIRSGGTYTFRQFGLLKPRKMPNGKTLIALAPEGFPRWAVGELVVAFMHQPASRTGFQTTVGLAQGKLNMLNGRVTNEFNNRGLFDGVYIQEGLLSAKERAMLSSQGAVDAATFIGLVGRAVTGNWLATGEMR